MVGLATAAKCENNNEKNIRRNRWRGGRRKEPTAGDKHEQKKHEKREGKVNEELPGHSQKQNKTSKQTKKG